MPISKKALKMIAHHEGVRTKPYQCPAKLWTIGVGHVIDPNHAKIPVEERAKLPCPPGWNRTFTMEEVDAILAKDLERFERGVLKFCPAAGSRQGWLDALVSFSFNVGLGTLQRSTLRQKFNRGDYTGAADEFLKYTKAAGKVLKGLVNRRNDERALFIGG
jgi:lysozyme